MTRGLLCWLALTLLSACASSDPEETPPVDDRERLPGGDTTNTLLFGSNAFTLPAANITEEHESVFYTGNSFFSQSWVEAPSSTEGRDGLGPLFNARSCSGCHFKDGRGRPPLEPDEDFLGILIRLSVPGAGEHGEPLPDPVYGGQLQPFAIPGVPAEGTPRVSYLEVTQEYDDGEPYTLLEPTYTLEDLGYGPTDPGLLISPRVAPATTGLGLLEAIPESRLKELEDPDDENGDGISGRINRVWDIEREQESVGRFGWKAEQPTVRQQSAGAFVGDIGITSTLFRAQDCTGAEPECGAATSGGEPEIDDPLLLRVVLYSKLLAVPARQGDRDPAVLKGRQLFREIGCAGCHVPEHETGKDPDFPELSGQTVFPYTDLLLHDLGPELSDDRPSLGASGPEWRTPPLWGMAHYQEVNGHDRLLHDGRARGVAEAILWHGGEADPARRAFRALSADERDDLVAFVESL